jgi:hypothetical protein
MQLSVACQLLAYLAAGVAGGGDFGGKNKETTTKHYETPVMS